MNQYGLCEKFSLLQRNSRQRLIPKPPPASSPQVAAVMRGNRGKNTRPELTLRSALWSAGLRGHRVNVGGLPGRPDIVVKRARLAVFVHGCFWHRCPACNLPLPRANRDYWEAKLNRNVTRDLQNRANLEDDGWVVIEVWECELSTGASGIIQDVVSRITRQIGVMQIPSSS